VLPRQEDDPQERHLGVEREREEHPQLERQDLESMGLRGLVDGGKVVDEIVDAARRVMDDDGGEPDSRVQEDRREHGRLPPGGLARRGRNPTCVGREGSRQPRPGRAGAQRQDDETAAIRALVAATALTVSRPVTPSSRQVRTIWPEAPVPASTIRVDRGGSPARGPRRRSRPVGPRERSPAPPT
jgi:hypothetical protein